MQLPHVVHTCGVVNRIAVYLLCFFLAAGVHASEVLELNDADFVMSQGGALPAEGARWTHLKLPDSWSVSRPGVGGDGWYRLRFRLDAVPREGQAIYLPQLCMNAAVYLNGMFVGSGGKFSEPVARNWNRPLFFLFAPGQLHPGENTLLIHVRSPAYSVGNLSPVYIGPESVLRPEYEEKFFWRITVNQTATLIIASMGLFMLALWQLRRQDTMYGYFGLSALVWALHSSNLFVQSVPAPSRVWETLVSVTCVAFISLLLISLLRFLGLHQRMLEKGLWLILAATAVSLPLLPDDWLIPAALFWELAIMLGSIAVGWLLLRAAVRKPQRDTLLLVGAVCMTIAFGIHDWFKQTVMLYRGDMHWLHYGAPLLFLAVVAAMTNRFAHALNQVERLNVDLEHKVRAKHAELEAQFASVQEMGKRQAMMEERERIFRDLHDDVGAKLLGLAISAQRANLPTQADLAQGEFVLSTNS